MKIKHILVRHKFEAEDVLRLIKEGKEFAALAKRFSVCPSSNDGGDLGEISEKNLDEDFYSAAAALNPGQISGVVKTRFGYHIISRS